MGSPRISPCLRAQAGSWSLHVSWLYAACVSHALAQAPDTAPAPRNDAVVLDTTGPTKTVSDPPPDYERAIDQAVDEHERGNFEEAREHFREAHELYPNARTLRGLGMVEFELRNYGESAKFLTGALNEQTRALDAELRHEVEVLLDRARAYVGEVRVAVEPGTATVSVDGVPVASGPNAALNLLVGDHLLEFRASGRMPERRQISVRGRDQITIQVVLAAPESSAHTMPTERRADEAPTYKKWWVWTAAGVLVAGATTAIVVAATRDRTAPISGGTSGVVLTNP